MNQNNFTPDLKIWKLEQSYDETNEMPEYTKINIYSHVGNFNNNSDVFLVVIETGGQGLFVSDNFEDYNNLDMDNFYRSDDSQAAFIVIGNWEISSLFDLIRSYESQKQLSHLLKNLI